MFTAVQNFSKFFILQNIFCIKKTMSHLLNDILIWNLVYFIIRQVFNLNFFF